MGEINKKNDIRDIILKKYSEKNIRDRILILTTKQEGDTKNDMYSQKEQERLFNDVASAMGIILPKINAIIGNGDLKNKDYYKWYLESLLMNILMSTSHMWYGKSHFITMMSRFYDMLELPEDTTLIEWLNNEDNQQ